MKEKILPKMKTFSPPHKQYVIAVLNEVVRYYGDLLLGFAVFGSYARGDNHHNSDLDLLIVLKEAPGFSLRLREFVDNIEMKHEVLAQKLYEQEDIHLELSPYILTRAEALKMHPLYFDLVEHHCIIYDPDHIIARIISSTEIILRKSGARKNRVGNTWEWQTGKMGFLGGMDL